MDSDSIDITEFRRERERLEKERLIEYYGIKPYEDIREHYIQRLKERYNIVISDEEYDAILDDVKKNNFIKIYSLSFNRKIIWVKIRDKYVLSIYNKKVKNLRVGALLTCLELNESLRIPVPKMFGINGFKPIDFENSVNNIIKGAFDLLDDYNRMGTRDFFINYPADKHLKSLIYFWAKTGEIELDKVIDHLYHKCMNDGTFKIKEIKY